MREYRLDLVTAPASEPVTLTEAKNFLRVDGSDDDDLITSLIVVARTNAESYTRRSFIDQTWKLFLNEWPVKKSDEWWDGVRELPISNLKGVDSIEIPKAPLSSVTHIKTYDDADSATTFSTDNYYVSVYSGDFAEKGKITLRDGESWPTFERNADGIEIQFVAGYGATASSVPSQIKQAILHEISNLYENRGDCSGDVCCDISMKLLQSFRLMKV